MTMQGLRVVLLLFAVVGYAGGGASLAVARFRLVGAGDRDVGLLGIAAMLIMFGALCTLAATDAWGILAFGGVIGWASYVLMAQRIDLFRIEAVHEAFVPSRHSGREPRRTR